MRVEQQRITVLYPGVESRFRPIRVPDLLNTVRESYALPSRYVLGLSTLQPRKNFAGLVEGFRRLLRARENEPAVADLHLVIAGGEGWMVEDTFAAAGQAGMKDRVHLIGFVEDDDLPALYSLAAAFAFPTWYEGFGLPVLEAMACGTPVVCADNSSLPEVAGGAALMVDAGDPDALAEALFQVLAREDLRAQMAAAGLDQALRFTWPAAARQLLDIYNTLV
jgi:glycosyltransferase involved in cell wall biosynthesis